MRVMQEVYSVPWPLAWYGATVKLARKASREAADVDHLLDLAKRLLHDLAGLDCDRPAERCFAEAQLFGEAADDKADRVQGGFRHAELPHEVVDGGGVWL